MPREFNIPFELRHLVYFREVAKRLHFRQAAEALAIAQPALSRSIAQLEDAVGGKLFERTRRGVTLTPAGHLLLERSEALLRGAAQLPSDVKAVAAGEIGHIRVGFTGLAMSTVLPGILRQFHAKHPRIRLELTESPTSTQIPAIMAGDLACGFFHPDAPTPRLKTRLLLRERNGVLLPANHPRARGASLKLKDLADTPFVLFPRTHNAGFYDRILAAFSSAGITPRIAEEIWPRANGVGLVRAGLGATFMTPSEAQQLPADVVFHPLEGAAPESRLVLGWKGARPEAVVQPFVDIASSHAIDAT
jgi:DNA-binding transcriptional LysR family regulator